ncbi:MAG: hypothetical protein JXQ29_02080 [Planctomycetes bacterium]|nr:hypothetical protein [Planctomycetota bacterium]
MNRVLALAIVAAVFGGIASSQPMTLEYQGRYLCQPGPDHLVATVGLSGDRALVGGNLGIALVDLNALPASGTRNYLARVTWGDPRDFTVSRDERHVFVNTYLAGFTVVGLLPTTLTRVTSIREPGVYYEKMCLDGDHLFVAAHAQGLRVFDVTQPSSPTLVGQLAQGFVDAFAVAVDGTHAYVADGAGGLKIVDVSDRRAPKLVAGETFETAVGTYQDVSVKNGRVYAAAGSAGLAVYEAGQLASRTLYPVAGCAESLCWVGDHLAVGAIAGVEVFAIGNGTAVTRVAGETSHRQGLNAALRLAYGVGAAGNRLLVANWNDLDMFELKSAAMGTQPDIDCDVQRVRFGSAGERCRATVTNGGPGALQISSVATSSAEFSVNWAGGTLAPGKSVTFDITYHGGGSGSGLVWLYSDDPDENPLPIQVFGQTEFLDPGETAPDFTVPTLTRDPRTGKLLEGTFSLAQQRGKAIWFHVYASW